MRHLRGTVLEGRYRLESFIASGGMAEVWRGHDDTLGRPVAVKIMHSQLSADPGFLARFRAEARHTASVNHAGVADVYDYGETHETEGPTEAFLVMQLVDGEPLSALLARVGRLSPERTLDVIADVATSLQAAHDVGLVHRDVKPANLMLTADGSVIVTDFGIARTADSAQLTHTGQVIGTAAYIAPEQAAGQPATPATDLYSLGVVAYECVTGRRPFTGENPLGVALAHLRSDPEPLPPTVPPALRAIIEQAMSKDPAHRFPSAAAMATAARGAKTGQRHPSPTLPLPVTPLPVTPRPVTPRPVTPTPSRRRGWPAAVVAGLTILVALAAGLLALGTRTPPSPGGAPSSRTPSIPAPQPSAAPIVGTRSPAASPVFIDPRRYLGRSLASATADLERRGFHVIARGTGGKHHGGATVTDLAPTSVQPGGTVTLFYTRGKNKE